MTISEFKTEVERCLPDEEVVGIHAGPNGIWVTLPGAEPLSITYRSIDGSWRVSLVKSSITTIDADLSVALKSLHDVLLKEQTRYHARLDRAQEQYAAFVQRLPPTREQEV